MNQTIPVDPPILEKLENLLGNLKKFENDIRIAIHHANDTHSFDDIVHMVISGRLHFFAFEKSFTLMEVVNYPKFNVYHCFIAGGKLDGVIESIEPMQQVARSLNCKFLSMAGRKGWGKVLAERGWKHVATTMYIEV